MSRARVLLLAGFALLVLAIAVPPFVNINRFRHSIVQSISDGLGRPVYASAVELTLLPRPAFVLHHLTVADWPSYGAEPVIMAETVTASLRASTLWHRRVEIASLHFEAPSLNLARDAQGQWNVESLISNFPALRPGTAASASSPVLPQPFPYVEATEARINFKMGTEKLPFSLETADLALWKESGNQWHVRIKARPVRTDLPPADAGQILGEASITSSGELMRAPIRANLEWRRGPLGEISRLLHGDDSGWRGTVDWTANVHGTLADILLTSDVQVEEFRRAEFIPPSEIDLAAHCQAQYVHADRRLESLACDAPVGGGHLRLRTNVPGTSPTSPSDLVPPISQAEDPASLQFTLQHVSMGFFLDLLRHVHPGVSVDAAVSGEVNGTANCAWRGLDTLNVCTGEVRSTPITLNLAHLDAPLHLSPLLLSSLAAPDPSDLSSSKRQSRKIKPFHPAAPVASPGTVWNLAPTHVSLAGNAPATVFGTLVPSGLTLNITGPADLNELNQLGRSLNFPAIPGGIRSIHGNAQLTLSVQSTWLPQPSPNAVSNGAPGTDTPTAVPAQLAPPNWFAPSQWSGNLQMANATLKIGSLPGAIQIATARVDLAPDSVDWTRLTGTYAHIPFDGNMRWQTDCPASTSPCARSFALHTSNLNVDHFQTFLRQDHTDSNLLDRINPWAQGVPELPELSGTFNADLLSAGKLSLKNVSLQLHLQGHRADLVAISGTVFGGTLSGVSEYAPHPASTGTASLTGSPRTDAGPPSKTIDRTVGSAQWGDGSPVYSLRAALRNLQPDEVAALWHQRWGRGAANLEIHLNTRGWSSAELAENASGNFSMDWQDGTLAATSPAAASRLSGAANAVFRFQQLHADGVIRNQALVLDSGTIVLANPRPLRPASSPAPQSLSGSATFARVLDLHLQPSGLAITGPINQPVLKVRSAKASLRQ